MNIKNILIEIIKYNLIQIFIYNYKKLFKTQI